MGNCLIGPCFDSEGQLRGIIQLINKDGGELISFQDEREFKNLLPTVAEMIKHADEIKYTSDVFANMNLKLAFSRDSIISSAKVYEERNLSKVHSALQQVVNRVDSFVKQKQQNSFKETAITHALFGEMREEKVIQEKKAKTEAMMQAKSPTNASAAEEGTP